jgi:hypothetical protein
MPGHGPAPVMVDQVEPARPGPVGQGQGVGDQLRHPVVTHGLRPGPASTPRWLGGERPVAGVDQRLGQLGPAGGGLREPVQQQHRLPGRVARGQDVEHQPAGVKAPSLIMVASG